MQEEKVQIPADSTSDNATSSETLSDIEEKEDISDEQGDSASSVPLSPDGDVSSDSGERGPNDDVSAL